MTGHETGSWGIVYRITLFSTMTQNSAVDTLAIGTHHTFGRIIMGAQDAAEGGGVGGRDQPAGQPPR